MARRAPIRGPAHTHGRSFKYLNISFINTPRYCVISHATAGFCVGAARRIIRFGVATRMCRKTTASVKAYGTYANKHESLNPDKLIRITSQT